MPPLLVGVSLFLPPEPVLPAFSPDFGLIGFFGLLRSPVAAAVMLDEYTRTANTATS